MADDRSNIQARPPARSRPVRRLLLGAFIVLIVLAGVGLYTQRHTIGLILSGSDIVGGQAAATGLHLPPGFHATTFASGLNGPRFIAFAPDGVLYVTERSTGSIVAFPDPDHTGAATKRIVVATGLSDPTSLAFANGMLYVGERTRVTRFTWGPGEQVSNKQVIVDNLPGDGNHVTRTVLIGPDGNLYVSIGSTCNNCVETDPHRASVWVYPPDGGTGRRYVSGLRNAVGLAENPWNNQIWATNNGRDNMGDNTPPETVYALQDGGNYGWPRCQAGTIIDPDLGHAGDCNGVIQPLVKMQAHSAPLGLAFYNGAKFPQQYHGLFVAFHGSWNRSIPTGYKVVFVPLDGRGNVAGQPQDFATGWLDLKNNTATGRPVGLAVGPDGALYLSDDKAGLVYRITYSNS
ncbi:MAG: PQQ-dependent sugar dehydrogenase [Ktedonobacterales bacterium]